MQKFIWKDEKKIYPPAPACMDTKGSEETKISPSFKS